jgi:hypothetical protein
VLIVLNVWNLEPTILSITSSTKLAPIAPQNQALHPLAHWQAPPLVLLLPCHWQSLVRVFIFTYLLSLTTILVANNAGSEVAIELDIAGSSTSVLLSHAAPVASTSHSRLDNTLAEVTRPAKKVKLPNAAVVGSGFTGKYDTQAHLVMVFVVAHVFIFYRNFAMKHWLDTNNGGSKVDFEVFFKSLAVDQKKVRCPDSVSACTLIIKKVYDNQAKMAVSVADGALFMTCYHLTFTTEKTSKGGEGIKTVM